MATSLSDALKGPSSRRTLSARPFRAVESQHLVATRKLVDSNEEQRVLEELIELKKPALPDESWRKLHYLLFTPFRYPPLPWGSRFGTRFEPGIWYGSVELRTAFAETAYYRLLFLEGSAAELAPLRLELSVLRVRVKTRRGVDLTAAPFAAHESELRSKSRYDATQALGRALREAGVDAFRYRSARDAEGGSNIGLFTPRAFAERRPHEVQSWFATVERERVEFVRKSYFERAGFSFPRAQFLVKGRLPPPSH